MNDPKFKIPSCADKCFNHRPGEFICDVLRVENEKLYKKYIEEEYSKEKLKEVNQNLLKKINKLEWIIAILVSILFSIGYLFLLKLCIWWLL